MKHSKITVGMVTLLTAASVLAGCTTDTATPQTSDATGVTITTEPGEITPTADATGSAAPTDAAPTPAPVEVKAGDKLTKAEAETLPIGTKGYELPDGTIVAVKAKEPLPKAVAKDVERLKDTTIFKPKATLESSMAGLAAASELSAEITKRTGKYAIVLHRNRGIDRCAYAPDVYDVWELTKGFADNCPVYSDKEQALKDAKSYVKNALGGPESWLILVAD